MIDELKLSQFEQVRPLFQGLAYHLAIFSVIEGNSPGRIWVDHPRRPQTALVWDKAEGELYLAGFEGDDEFNQALNQCIRQQIYPEARRLSRMLDFALNYFPEAWESELGVVLRDTAPMKHYRQHFTFKQLKVDWKSQLPDGLVMTRVDEKLLARTELKNIEQVSRWVLRSWQSAPNYMEKGFGFCLLHGDTLACWCIADYAAGKAYEISLHTDEDYRRRGLATLTVAAAVEHCLAQGASKIGWHCWSSNVASAATARKVGFEQTIEHPVYHAWYNRFDNLLVQGLFNLQYQRYGAAAQATKRLSRCAIMATRTPWPRTSTPMGKPSGGATTIQPAPGLWGEIAGPRSEISTKRSKRGGWMWNIWSGTKDSRVYMKQKSGNHSYPTSVN